MEVYGHSVMNEESLRKWCIMINGGRSNVHNEEQSARSCLVTENIQDKNLTEKL